MLELKNIKKDYKLKDQEPVHALKGISLKFRSNELVAILGPSGCGKTTLLNITGGLDHYDSGDLIIKGKSTKHFNDRDWDTYRNHSVGFVFQSYNLISHQNILNNVALALTITGLKKEERIKRSKAALDKVGLKGMYKKKPNQLSGGQMQRVAIARALVNNPEIVLADEPTGALDSQTSIQIMDLLKEVANEHLVIMVTHNPELAYQYATRIVKMKDGEVLEDSMPYDGKEEKTETYKKEEGKKLSSMNFFTGMGLSLSNLISKLNRTILVSVAGSIGIIGVSTILGVSCGVNGYIANMENDMLSAYPIALEEKAVDMTSLLSGLSTQDKKELAKFDTSTQIGMDSMVNYLMSKFTDITNVKTNDINKELLTYIAQMPDSYYSSYRLDYKIDPTNNFFTTFKKTDTSSSDVLSINGLSQAYIATLKTVQGFKEYASYVDMFTNFMKELPATEEYVLNQYDMVAGTKFPTEANELALVVDKKTTMTDLVLAQMGFYPESQFLNIAKKAVKCNEAYKQYINKEITESEYEALLELYDSLYPYETKFNDEDILNHEFYYFPHSSLYKENPDFVSHKQVSVSMSGQNTFLGETFITGLQYDAASDSLSGNLISIDSSYNIDINQTIILLRDKTYLVTNPNKSVVDGRWALDFGDNHISLIIETTNKTPAGESTFTFDATGSLTFQIAGMPFPMTTAMNSGKITEVEPDTPDYWYNFKLPQADENGNAQDDMLDDPIKYGGYKVKITSILRAKDSTNFGSLSRGVYYTPKLTEKYMEDAANSKAVQTFVNHIDNGNYIVSPYNAYVSFKYSDYTNDDSSETFVAPIVDGYASALNGSSSSGMTGFLSALAGGGKNNLDTDKAHLRSMSGQKARTYVEDAHLAIADETKKIETFNADVSYYGGLYTYNETAKVYSPASSYVAGETYYYKSYEKSPAGIHFYPNDFDGKDNLVNYLNKWNQNADITLDIGGGEIRTLVRDERADITVTDTISVIVTTISTLVTTISFALIAFTSLSLVVSCFMIAVITFISVMERIKEIGVIRSLGGRKRDVSQLFIAENLITGFASGAFGIAFTYVLQIIINAIVAPMGVKNICALPFTYALIMIGIAVLLSVLSGLIPSLKASKQDPVIALRSE